MSSIPSFRMSFRMPSTAPSDPRRGSRRRRVAAVTTLAAATVVLLAGPASAHVTVNPSSAVQGSYTEVNVRVPNEEQTANTTEIQFFLPTDHPIASVSTESVPGWTVKVQTTKLSTPLTTDDGVVTDAVSEITWSGGVIKPGQFQDFAVQMGPLPTDTSSLTFKALQTYSDGTIVRWIQPSVAGQPEPANPAPVLQLTSAAAAQPSSTSSSITATAGADTAGPKVTTTAAPAASGSDTIARVLGGVGVFVGLLGVAFGFLGWRRGSGSAPRGTGGA